MTGGGDLAEDPRLDLWAGTRRTFLHVLPSTVLVPVMNDSPWSAVP